MLDRIKQCCTFAVQNDGNPIASVQGYTINRKKGFPPYKRKSGKAVKRQTEKVNTTFFEKSAFVVIGEIECTLFQCIAFEVQKPFFLNKADRNGKG